jgi:hypothetical protein
MSSETQQDFDEPESLALFSFIGAIAVFLVFSSRLVNFSCCSDRDSIAYVPSLVHRTFFDEYNLLEFIMKLRSRPPIVFLRGGPPDDFETTVEYGSWRDTSDVPLTLKKRFLVDLSCEVHYDVADDLRVVIEQEKADARNENRTVSVAVQIDTPGYGPRIFATTRGAVPGYLSFMGSPPGVSLRILLMLVGYHSIMECVLMLMMSKQTIVLKKELSMATDQWTAMGMDELLDYHSIPTIL